MFQSELFFSLRYRQRYSHLRCKAGNHPRHFHYLHLIRHLVMILLCNFLDVSPLVLAIALSEVHISPCHTFYLCLQQSSTLIQSFKCLHLRLAKYKLDFITFLKSSVTSWASREMNNSPAKGLPWYASAFPPQVIKL